jgi:hypothetical protein
MSIDDLIQRLMRHGMPETVARERMGAEAELPAMCDEDAQRLVEEWQREVAMSVIDRNTEQWKKSADH